MLKINLLLATVAGLFTWLVLSLLGVDIAVPLAILVALFDLVPLIGLTIGGLFVAVVVSFDSFPTDLIVWVVAFLAFQQVQDRVVQPMLYGRAVRISPRIAIVALLAGAQILGILGALIAIPVAASIGAVVGELRRPSGQEASGREPEPEPTGA
jgi:predicted PurR-regulated permease PerM